MQEKKQLIFNMGAQTVSFCVSMLISFFLTQYIVEKIGTEVYGFVGLANNVTSYVTVFTVAINSLANRYITIAYVKGDLRSANKYFSSVTAANIVVDVIVTVPAVLLVVFLEKVINVPADYVFDIKLLWGFLFLLFALQLIFGRLEVATFIKNRLDKSAMRTMESNLMKAALLVILYALFVPKVYYVGIAAIISGTYVFLTNAYYMKKLTPELKFSRSLVEGGAVKELIGNGIWNSANQLSQLLFNGLDLLLANLFISETGMGLLSISKTLPLNIIAFIGMVANVFNPGMTVSYAKGDTDEFVQETSFAVKVCGFVCSVPIIGIMIFGKPFYHIWLPSLSAGDVSEISILAILTLIPQFFSIYIFPLYQVNTLTCKLKIPSIVNITLGVLNVLIVFVLLKFTNLGLYAIAGVSSVLLTFRILVFVPMYAAHSLKKSVFTFYPAMFRGLILNGVLIVFFLFMRRFITEGSFISFGIWVGISAIAGYLLGILIIFKKSDLKKIIGMVKKR